MEGSWDVSDVHEFRMELQTVGRCKQLSRFILGAYHLPSLNLKTHCDMRAYCACLMNPWIGLHHTVYLIAESHNDMHINYRQTY